MCLFSLFSIPGARALFGPSGARSRGFYQYFLISYRKYTNSKEIFVSSNFRIFLQGSCFIKTELIDTWLNVYIKVIVHLPTKAVNKSFFEVVPLRPLRAPRRRIFFDFFSLMAWPLTLLLKKRIFFGGFPLSIRQWNTVVH